MPGTAAERQLLNPFDPIQALPKSAEFLSELRRQFGNLGLAAAAYNAGPRRVREWLAGSGGMPAETRSYVAAITGLSVEQWAKGGDDRKPHPGPGCGELMALLKRTPNPFYAALEQRVIHGAIQPWGAILGADRSRERMLAKYAALQQRHAEVLAGRDPILFERRRSSLPRYQVRVGADTAPFDTVTPDATGQYRVQFPASSRILLDLAKSGHPLADRIVTTSPDVTVSTNLGAFVNQRGLFRRRELKDVFQAAKIPSAQKWSGHGAARASPHGEPGERAVACRLVLSGSGRQL